ncbi:alpha/beta hydrolase family protein [Actinokineospora bangkokensis]|uniref:S28 family serine protease n=1 Tax=Actinokineospora bangkokensis TaxID=1193682 RepID=UPI0022B91BFF|nr:S28 family serine protease [Actinokineospora bangkokensis]
MSLVVAVLAVLGVVATPALASPAAPSADILDRLQAVPGLTVTEAQAPQGYRFFFLTITQPVDHRKPRGATFEQRFQLLHRDVSRPVVLHTTGYGMPGYAFRSEPTRLLDGNQISVEQRFFTPSRPDPADWSDLDIWQAATDHHRIVEALKAIYPAKWVATGASKGGMTSVYHRRFYPSDLDAVVAYVAPNDRVNPEDGAYDRFFARVGTPECRAKLDDVQEQALLRRAEMEARYQAAADAEGWTFTQVLGSLDKAYEMTVLDTVWAFWQYSTEADCASVPAATASTDELYAFIDQVAGFSFYSDQGVLPYAPYYYQAATQLGWPSLRFAHLRGLTRYPGLYQANSNLPPALRSRHQALPMLDVDQWVRTSASQMLFVYGGNDPWGAEPFTPSRRDSYSYTAPGANHGANIEALVPAERDAAKATLLRWAGLGTTAQARVAQLPVTDLDRAEPRLERRPL